MLRVVTEPDTVTATAVTFVVPGHQRWTLRTVHADVSRDVGGAPNRGYRLTVTDGTTPVVQAGADDAGTEPGTCSVTWANAAAGAVAAGAVGTVVAGMAPVLLTRGYTLTVEILNPAPADQILDAAVWCDYVDHL